LFSIISKNSLHFNFLYAISKILSAMNGKITDFRRKERIGRRLQANLRQLRLVRPGAAMETWPDRPPLSIGHKHPMYNRARPDKGHLHRHGL
jgi:hypothetical protein